MIVFPNAKINIGLFVTSVREDGYHNIETLFYPVYSLYDVLEVIRNNGKEDEFSSSGIEIDSAPADNICIKALNLMRQDAGIPPLKIHLHKNIPIGAGLGGGSADASFMLKLLNEQFSIGMSNSMLEKLAAGLGADCPVFIENKAVLARGTGNEFHPIECNLDGLWLNLVVPKIHITTAQAYRGVSPAQAAMPLSMLIKRPTEQWKDGVTNDFERSIFKTHPSIEEIKNKMYQNGALYASMSGSGSAVYGIFREKQDIKWPEDYFVHNEPFQAI